MQHRKGFIIAVTAGLLVATGIGHGQAGDSTKPIKSTFAGTSLTTRMNLDPSDGSLAGWATTLNKGNGGQSMNQAVAERRVADPPTGFCDGGLLEFELVAGRSISTNMVTRDQIFTQLISSPLCLDLTTLEFFGESDSIIIGGTGKNEGASGELHQTFRGTTSFFDPVANQSFGSITGESEGTLTLP